MKFNFLILTLVFSIASVGRAEGLTIHAAEFGIGKFHRQDNRVHPYSDSNAWKVFILPENANLNESTLVVENGSNSFTIFYSSLEELLQRAQTLANAQNQKIDVINLNAHGMPGGMWFPKDAAQRESKECADWRQAAQGSDDDNYDQYYSAISRSEIMQMRAISQFPSNYGCTAGLPAWSEIIARNPTFKTVLAPRFQLHLLSCIVGLGPVGDKFTKGLADLLLTSTEGSVQSSLKYGLGDWSMPEGMGFWDYINDEQLARDNAAYPVDRADRPMAQPGLIRVASLNSGGAATSAFIGEVDFMLLTLDNRPTHTVDEPLFPMREADLPSEVRLPGTRFKTQRLQ